ncbi:MAG TPA: hypothetical protein DCW74_04765, partial [Alteromonas australica]|nr:hypothetical protein [Alteromonas australica]
TATALATRTMSDFDVFDECVAGYQTFATLQILNKTKKRGWFLNNDQLKSCGWSATLKDFAKGSVIFDYEHCFGMGNTGPVDTGINFQAPRLQILWVSPLGIEAQEDGDGYKRGTTIGTFEDLDAKAKFDADKVAAELADSKNEMYKRKFTVRTKYLVYIMTKDNQRAHQTPLVLSIKGLNGTDMAEKHKLFRKEMDNCWSKFKNFSAPMAMNDKFHACTIFQPTLAADMRGSRSNEICAIESFEIPAYETQEEAEASIDKFMVPTNEFQSTWEMQETYADYYTQHAQQTARRLGGAYGIKEGVNILPASVDSGATTVDVVSTPTRDELGADTTL